MNDKQTKFLVGFFVAGGLAIIVATVIWLGMSNFFKKGDLYSIFFDESVQGLTVEAPVKYRGVPIGRVQFIKVAADSHLIEVVIELDQEFTMQSRVIAQLKVVGITGNMFIELDHQGVQSFSPVETPLSFPTEYPVIQSRSSDIKQLFDSVDEIVQNIRTINIAELATGIQETMQHVDNAIVGANIAGLSSQIQTTLQQFDSVLSDNNLPAMIQSLSSLMTQIDHSVQALDTAGISAEAKKSLRDIREQSQALLRSTKPLLSSTKKTIGTAEATLENFNHQLLLISQQTERTNSRLNDLIDHISEQPSQLLFGDAPERRLQ